MTAQMALKPVFISSLCTGRSLSNFSQEPRTTMKFASVFGRISKSLRAPAMSSYVMGWPQYSIHDTYWNFHAGVQAPEVAQNNFLYFQHYLLARPQSATYYNTVKDAASGFGPLFYDIPDPISEDRYYTSLGVCATSPGSVLVMWDRVITHIKAIMPA